MIERDWAATDPNDLDGWELFCWWCDHLVKEPRSSSVSKGWAKRGEAGAFQWLFKQAFHVAKFLGKSTGERGFDACVEDRAYSAAASLTEQVQRKRWRPPYVHDEVGLRSFVRTKLRYVMLDDARRWRSNDPESMAKVTLSQAREDAGTLGSLSEGVGHVARGPVDINELGGGEETSLAKRGAETPEDVRARYLYPLVEDCVNAQERADARRNVKRGLNELGDLRQEERTMEDLIEEELRDKGANPTDPAERRQARARVNKRHSRAREALAAWLVRWQCDATGVEVERRKMIATHVPEFFHLRAPPRADGSPAEGEDDNGA